LNEQSSVDGITSFVELKEVMTALHITEDQEENGLSHSPSSQSLLAKAMEDASPDLPPVVFEQTPKASHNLVENHVYFPTLIASSDYTLPTSNFSSQEIGAAPPSPPAATHPRRQVMGCKAESRYLALGDSETPPGSPQNLIFTSLQSHFLSPLTPAPPPSMPEEKKQHTQSYSQSLHAQSLLLGIAFMAIWTPNNAMAPNLTEMANDFGMSEVERDLYLGSYISLALGVFCMPISALLGFMADFYSRKYLFVACVAGGSLSTLWTAYATTFTSLFWARLSCGGCMSASVSVAFSLLGDLFCVEERNAASSGLTAMMGLGMIAGQVYAGMVGPVVGWPHPFVVSSVIQAISGVMVMLWVTEPTRGGKEQALQELIKSGKKYDRQLTLGGFLHAMKHNRSNSILLWQGFFTSLPWGIVFCFLNDYLSQEKGFSVPDATLLVMLFGIGCAIGGITGGYIGQQCIRYNRSYLPYFMAFATFLGILPFLLLLNTDFGGGPLGYRAMTYSILGGCIASLPSVSVRPCIINVNPPETRGAALTASNLFITLGRGIGPSCITLMGSLGHLSRQTSFNWTLTVFWTITAIHLVFLGKTLPSDQDDMEAELERYAAEAAQDDEEEITLTASPIRRTNLLNMSYEECDFSTTEEYMTSINTFDGLAARQSLQFVSLGIKELKEEITYFGNACGPCAPGDADFISSASSGSSDEIIQKPRWPISTPEMNRRKQAWKRQKQKTASEDTPLL
jgi:translation initiation factor 4G